MKTKLLVSGLILTISTQVFASPVSTQDKADQLLTAIETDNVFLVDSLVRYGIDPNYNTSLYNMTPLMYAVDNGSVDVVERLIDIGSNVDVADNFGTTPLIQAIKNNRKDVASLLIKKSRNIDMRDDKGLSALHYAAKQGDEVTFKQILKRGGNLKAVDNSGNNALFYAIAGRNKEIVNRLISMKYFDLAHTNRSGENALKIAERYGLNDVATRISRGRN